MSITVWYLEMTAPEQLRPARARGPEVAIERIHPPSAEGSRRLYEQVGRPWRWSDRAAWDDAAWEAHVGRPAVETWVATVGGEQAGYAELVSAGGDIEIASFGLRELFIGRGLGGVLLEAAVRRAWEHHPRRVWLHTCSLDSPAALPSYQRRGFRLYDERTE
jgi:GNAT superfamily N-acetyltransferase